MGPNEPCHQLLAPRVLKHFHRYPTAAKQVFLAAKRSIFANHHTRNAVKENPLHIAHGESVVYMVPSR